MEFSPELQKKAARAQSPAELLELAKGEGIELTPAEAEGLFGKLHPPAGELKDEELENVAGGGCGQSVPFPLNSHVQALITSLGMTRVCRHPGCRSDELVVIEVEGNYRKVACIHRHKDFQEENGRIVDAVTSHISLLRKYPG